MPHRILVIDHDDDARLLVCDQLLQMGFDAVGEDTGVSGLARIAQASGDTPFTGVALELRCPCSVEWQCYKNCGVAIPRSPSS